MFGKILALVLLLIILIIGYSVYRNCESGKGGLLNKVCYYIL
jgi:hypothetical protein